MTPHGQPQMRVALGTAEVTDTERRAIAWQEQGGSTLDVRRLATRDECRRYFGERAAAALNALVSEYLEAGGQTASMEGRSS